MNIANVRLGLGTLLCLTLAVTARGQDEACALPWMVEHAEVVGVARALGVRVEPGASVRVGFRLERVLRGDAPALLALEEPDGQGCGRALAGIVPGQRFLLCLRRRDGTLAPVAGGGRGLPLATAAVVDHAEALLRGGGAARVAILGAALASTDARVREDAALALPLTPGLEAAAAETRAAVVEALRAALSAEARTAASLLTAAQRLRAVEVVPFLVDAHLDGSDGVFAGAVAAAVSQLDPLATAAHVAAAALPTSQARHRAVRLLARLPAQPAEPGLVRLLGADEPAVRLHACTALLAGGKAASDLESKVDAETLAHAREQTAVARPRLRYVRPEQPR